jgi:modification methylase
MGSGTTAIVAKKLNRKFIGIDISPEYCQMAQERLNNPSSIVRSKNKKGETDQVSLFDMICIIVGVRNYYEL